MTPEHRGKSPTSSARRRTVRRHGAAVVGLVLLYTAAALTVPALRTAIESPELRIVIELSGLFLASFAALALLLPDEGDVAHARDAYVAGLLTLHASHALFGIGPLLLFGEPARGALAFYPFVAASYIAGLLFISASRTRGRLRLGPTLLCVTVALVACNVALLVVAERLSLPLPLTLVMGGMLIPSATVAQNAGFLALSGVLFSVGAWLAGRIFVQGATEIYLWLSLALWVEVLSGIHVALYPEVLGPVITSADLLRLLVFALLLVGALRKVRQLVVDRAAAIEAQAGDLRAQEGLLATMRDFTEREETFRSLVVHELATPLATVRAFAHVLESQMGATPSPAARTALEGLGSESRRLQQLIDRMEELRTLELAEFRCDLRPARLRPVLEDAARYLQGLPGAHEAVVSCADVRAEIDPVRFGQALRNVLTNAAHYSPDHSPILLECRMSDGGRVHVTVSDQGPGIPAPERERVLGKYERGGIGQGTGLGLYVARRIAEAHGGTFTVREATGGSGLAAVFNLRAVAP